MGVPSFATTPRFHQVTAIAAATLGRQRGRRAPLPLQGEVLLCATARGVVIPVVGALLLRGRHLLAGRSGVCRGGRHLHAAGRVFPRACSCLRTSLVPTWLPGSAGGPPPPQGEVLVSVLLSPFRERLSPRRCAGNTESPPWLPSSPSLKPPTTSQLTSSSSRHSRPTPSTALHPVRCRVVLGRRREPPKRRRVTRGQRHLRRCRRHRRRLLSRPTLSLALSPFREGQTSLPSPPRSSRPTYLKALPPPGEPP